MGESNMDSFTFPGIPTKVTFGQGKLDALPQVVESMGLQRCLVLTTPGQKHLGERVADLLGEQAVAVFNQAKMHTPLHITEQAMEVARKAQIDCTISIGGGSTTGLGKAIAVRLKLPQICIPTTYAGSEMTPTLGETVDGRKTTRRSEDIRPDAVIYDVNLTLALPVKTSLTSGMNAIAHAVESLYAKDTNPIVQHFAEEGIRKLASAMPQIQQDPQNLAARRDAQYGAWLCSICLGSTTMGLHHKICHAIGGALDLPHAETHTVVLPRALAYNAPAVPDAMKTIAAALPYAEGDAVKGLDMLVSSLELPNALSDYGMAETDVVKVVERVLDAAYENPMPLLPDRVRLLVALCWKGSEASHGNL